MAVNREFNWLGQARVDVPHLRMVEAAVRYDFDVVGYTLAGESPFVVRGFEVVGNPLNAEASRITIKTAGALAIHPLATENGSFFAVPSNRPNEVLDPALNSRMTSACQASSVNYIGIDLRRRADSTTSDLVQFLNPSSNLEVGQKFPLARTLDYVFVVSQTDFSYNRSILPIAIVETNAQNVVTSCIDARPMWCRLTPGGSVGSTVNPYGWPGGRVESATSMVAGDKSITSLKAWQDSVMTRLWELGGGEQWYSPTADRNVQLHTGASVFASTGESFEVDAGNLHWQGVSFGFDNTLEQFTVAVADQLTSVAGLTDLASGECIYVDLDRTSASTIVAQKGVLKTLGVGQKPGSRWVIASRIGSNYYIKDQPWPIGSSFSLATVSHAGVIKTNLDFDPPNPVAATVITTGGAYQGSVTGSGLSHNTDIGTAQAFGSGDIRIGRGGAAGDDSIIIKTDGATKGTLIQGAGTSVPYLSVGAVTLPGETDKIVSFNNASCFLEGNHAWSNISIRLLPLRPQVSGTLPFPSFVKIFVKSDKTWKAPVRLMTQDPTKTALYTYDSVGKTLTKTSLDAPSFDGVTTIAGDRVWINVAGFAGNGLYEVTTIGVAEPFAGAVLTKTMDGGGPGSAEFLGQGFDIFDGVAVRILEGETYAGLMGVLDAPAIAEEVDLSVYQLNRTDGWTRDQLCCMWSDGSYTVIATSPMAYDVYAPA